jgi:hypothetical protein
MSQVTTGVCGDAALEPGDADVFATVAGRAFALAQRAAQGENDELLEGE